MDPLAVGDIDSVEAVRQAAVEASARQVRGVCEVSADSSDARQRDSVVWERAASLWRPSCVSALVPNGGSMHVLHFLQILHGYIPETEF